MTYEQFLEKLIEIGVYWEEPVEPEYGYSRCSLHDRNGKEFPRLPAQIQVKWRTGGVGGGSCWDTSGEDHHYFLDSDTEPEFNELEKILDEFCPNIGRIDYRQLYGKLIERDTESEYEYYGNSTSYATKTVKCRELFEYLVQKELIR